MQSGNRSNDDRKPRLRKFREGAEPRDKRKGERRRRKETREFKLQVAWGEV